MLYLLAISLILSLNIINHCDSCGKYETGIGIKPFEQVEESGTDGWIMAAAYGLTDEGTYKWTSWEHLDSGNCDDFVPGQIDYFSNFIKGDNALKSIDKIILKPCSHDGLCIEYVWMSDRPLINPVDTTPTECLRFGWKYNSVSEDPCCFWLDLDDGCHQFAYEYDENEDDWNYESDPFNTWADAPRSNIACKHPQNHNL